MNHAKMPEFFFYFVDENLVDCHADVNLFFILIGDKVLMSFY